MLTDSEERRIYDSVPNTTDVNFGGSMVQYSAPVWWENQDHNIEYPEIVLGWKSREVKRQTDQPINQIVEYDYNQGNPEVYIKRGQKLYDEMVVKCTTDNGINNDGIPGSNVAKSFTESISRHFKFKFDQNSEGPNDERPVLARVVSAPVHASELVDGQQSESYEFTVRFQYTETYIETVNSIRSVEDNTNIDPADLP